MTDGSSNQRPGGAPKKGGRPPGEPSGNKAPSPQVKDWIDLCTAFLRHHSTQIQMQAAFIVPEIDVARFVPDDRLEAIIRCGAQEYRVTLHVDFSSHKFSPECQCREPGLCVHTLLLGRFLHHQLTTRESEIRAVIEGQADPQRHLRQAMLLLGSVAREAGTTPPVDAETQEQPTRIRYLWNFSLQGTASRSSLLLRPLRQQETKSGGWSKGKEIELAQFMNSPALDWSGTDHNIAAAVIRRPWHPGFELNIAQALRILVGSHEVLLDKQPCEVQLRSFEVCVVEQGDDLQLSASPIEHRKAAEAEGHALRLATTPGMLVLVDQPRNRLICYPCGVAAVNLVRHLETVPVVVDADQRDTLLAQIGTLQNVLPIQLPDSVGGDEIPEPVEHVLLFRLRRTGQLDVSLTVRDRNQILLRPGSGLLRSHALESGRPVQYVRDAAAELEKAGMLVSRLNLDRCHKTGDWMWRVDAPDTVPELMSLAGELAGQKMLTIVWHRQSVSQFDVIGRVSVRNVRVDVARQRDWFGLQGSCRIGDTEVPLQHLLASLRGRQMPGLVEVSPGKWAAVAEELRSTLQKLADVSSENRGKLQLDASAALTIAALEDAQIQVQTDREWKECLQRVQSAQSLCPDPPASLMCTLRGYQIEGFRWLCRLSAWGVGGILADDMGLGKTVQTLAVLLERIESGPALVIAPTSLGYNWQSECERFAPALTPILLREADRAELLEKATEGQVIICSYGLALREAERLKKMKWGTLVLDEAQNIKNSNSKTAQQIRQLRAGWKVALTGTPMENHLGELWSLFHTISPGVLGSWEQFRRRFASPIEKDHDSERREALVRVISPFILRRSKKDVLSELPDRTEQNLLVDLSPEERRRYDEMRRAAIGELNSLDAGATELSSDHRFRILQLLTRLRQLSCHIGLVDKSWTGSSAKLDVLVEHLLQLRERGHRTLVFSQFTSHLALIRAACDQNNITCQYLDGQTTPAARNQRVKAFQAGEGDAFLISLKAGGTGLNLTAADYVIHMDPWWNPAVEDQATDRVHRIGQTKRVIVCRIIARGTIEEQILSLHEQKRDLVDSILAGSEAAGRLSTEELADLIRQGADDGVPTRNRSAQKPVAATQGS